MKQNQCKRLLCIGFNVDVVFDENAIYHTYSLKKIRSIQYMVANSTTSRYIAGILKGKVDRLMVICQHPRQYLEPISSVRKIFLYFSNCRNIQIHI